MVCHQIQSENSFHLALSLFKAGLVKFALSLSLKTWYFNRFEL